MKPTSNCYKCSKRTLGCHSICEDYKKFLIENEKYKKSIQQANELVRFDIATKEKLRKK
ncbi:hypothetical protein [uncultured Eubacterium sp.]|uniref:hypothetical protein n=1 Tax=uncultured Eubacterium sp. TaxID=165185 RepID=UPI00262E782C|nr:hypothetical protein [uncultured Eubacterium sp.]